MGETSYIVYDGRARFDEDAATILEVIGETRRALAIHDFQSDWEDHDAVLFEYDVDTENNCLINGRLVSDIFADEDYDFGD